MASDARFLKYAPVSKASVPVKALTDVRFELKRGEVHALCGENGAGKSTLMNMIAGVLQPTDGEILVDGTPVDPLARRAQSLGIGLVHQEIALCQDATVAENIFMAATNRRRSPS
jgi:ribose transport system ATP-binding protein